MPRFILRYVGKGTKPEQDVERVKALGGLKVLDESSPRMVLVEAPETPLTRLMESLPDWNQTAERFVPLPDSRPKVRARRD
ncbi:MAG: hypothetical protein EXS05_13470 [Planctomycetaceae bacterium]|nr:hypothetical protein [Planctomycetaceae bacterium]